MEDRIRDSVQIIDSVLVYIGIRKNHTSQKDSDQKHDSVQKDGIVFGVYSEQYFVVWLVHYITPHITLTLVARR